MERTFARADPARGRGSLVQRDGDRRPALIAYFDTAAFSKLFIREAGSGLVGETWLGARERFASLLLYPEARATLARAVRMGRLSRPAADRARDRLEQFWELATKVPVAPALSRRAGELAERFQLRGYDAVHLASAETVPFPRAVFVAADRDLASAATELGFSVVNPLA